MVQVLVIIKKSHQIQKKIIIKTIGQIKVKSIIIRNNINCIILIMDYSSSVIIQNYQNCSIFVAPCETLLKYKIIMN